MVLVDTSVWVAHFRSGTIRLGELLEKGKVVCHPFVIGELACGNLRNRREILSLLEALPTAMVAGYEEILQFIENHRLTRMGLGYVDVHLLAAALLTGVPLWTNDRTLRHAAARLRISYRDG